MGTKVTREQGAAAPQNVVIPAPVPQDQVVGLNFQEVADAKTLTQLAEEAYEKAYQLELDNLKRNAEDEHRKALVRLERYDAALAELEEELDRRENAVKYPPPLASDRELAARRSALEATQQQIAALNSTVNADDQLALADRGAWLAEYHASSRRQADWAGRNAYRATVHAGREKQIRLGLSLLRSEIDRELSSGGAVSGDPWNYFKVAETWQRALAQLFDEVPDNNNIRVAPRNDRVLRQQLAGLPDHFSGSADDCPLLLGQFALAGVDAGFIQAVKTLLGAVDGAAEHSRFLRQNSIRLAAAAYRAGFRIDNPHFLVFLTKVGHERLGATRDTNSSWIPQEVSDDSMKSTLRGNLDSKKVNQDYEDVDGIVKGAPSKVIEQKD